MKKIIFAMACVTIIFVACSKEAKLNKRLNGTWNATKVDGNALPSGVSMTITFDKEKKGKGTYNMSMTMPPAPTQTENGTYHLEDDKKLYVLSSAAGATEDTMLVVSYSKTDLKISSLNGTNVTEFTKK